MERSIALRSESGNALVETALLMSFIGVPLLLGTVYTSILYQDDIIIANAAVVGAEYGMVSTTYASDTSNIIAAARGEAIGLGSTLSVTPTVYWACSTALGGTTYTTSAAATAACTGGTSHALEFLKVVASASVTPPVTFPGLSPSVTLSSTSVMEVEE